MIAGPLSTIPTMTEAVARSRSAVAAAAELDEDCSEDDRLFFADRRIVLDGIFTGLLAAQRAIEDIDLGPGMLEQVRVELGDKVLDRGVEDGNQRTKIGLKNKPGLGAPHVFGKRVTELTQEKIAQEPKAVLLAVKRLGDVPDFDDKPKVAATMIRRANQQQVCLDDRAAGHEARELCVNQGKKLVVEAALELATLEGLLLARFTRQKDYVRTFFLDVSSPEKPKAKAAAKVAEPEKAGEAAKPPEAGKAAEPEKSAEKKPAG